MEFTHKKRSLLDQEKRIKDVDDKNQGLEKTIQETKNELHQNIINNEILNSQLRQENERLQEILAKEKSLSGKEKQEFTQEKKELRGQIEKHEKAIQYLEKSNKQLDIFLRAKEKELTKSFALQENLIEKLKKSKLDARSKEKTFFERLLSERKAQEQKYSNLLQESTSVINKILDQQEMDQKKSWYQKIKFQFSPNIEIHKNKKDAPEIDSYFYSGWSQEIANMPKIKERLSPEDNKWRVVEPKISNKK